MALLWAGPLLATSVIPITDAELYQRADVIVHGIVLSSDVTVDGRGIPETVTVIEPLAVLKGQLAGSLVLHQLGGTLPDGRFFKLWGRPEYVPGREVVVFAIARPEGEYQTAEMLLGKFEVQQDASGNMFAVPDLAAGVHPGVEVHALRSVQEEAPAVAADGNPGGAPAERAPQDAKSPRELATFLASLRAGVFEANASAKPSGSLTPVHHSEKAGSATPLWGNISDSLFRWNNDATATWTISGTANMDGGGMAEAQAALASWTNNPNSNINYTPGTGTSNILYVNATSSMLGCGWSTCLTGGGVIGCGGPTGVGGSTAWRGQTYTNINQAVAELRASCAYNGFGSVIAQSVMTHELGHTLGLGHSDQNVSTHDTCRGDEDAATMRSVVQSRTTLGTDDQDAIRWLYGDGNNSCGGGSPTVTSFTSSPASPQSPGTAITWTAMATGGAAPLQYRFYVYSFALGTWSIGHDYSTSNSWIWNPSQPGQYTFQVWVRNNGSSASYDAWAGSGNFSISGPPPTITSFVASPASPQSPGTAITWTAMATGGAAPLQYRFYVYSFALGTWSIGRDYATSNSWVWNPSQPGQYTFQVWVRNSGSSASYDAWAGSGNFNISGPPPTITSFVTNRASPQPLGTAITWTATATGGAAPLQYRFYVYSFALGTWSIGRDYSTSNSWIWNPSQSGQYTFQVWVRNSGSSASYDAWAGSGNFNILP